MMCRKTLLWLWPLIKVELSNMFTYFCDHLETMTWRKDKKIKQNTNIHRYKRAMELFRFTLISLGNIVQRIVKDQIEKLIVHFLFLLGSTSIFWQYKSINQTFFWDVFDRVHQHFSFYSRIDGRKKQWNDSSRKMSNSYCFCFAIIQQVYKSWFSSIFFLFFEYWSWWETRKPMMRIIEGEWLRRV